MTDWVGVSTAIAATASAAVSIIVALRVSDVRGEVVDVKQGLNTVAVHTNGMARAMSQLAEDKGIAVGTAVGRAEVHAEQAAAKVDNGQVTITADQIVTDKIVTSS